MWTNRGNWKTIIISVITSILTVITLLFIIAGYITRIQPLPEQRSELTPSTPSQSPAPQQISTEFQKSTNTAITNVVGQSVQSVVGLAVLRPNGDSIFDSKTREKWGIGSGIIVSSTGYILTNHHVAGGKNKKLLVTLSNGQVLEGITLWSDPIIDLAIVKVNANELPAAKLGDAKALKVGEPAIAIGNPLGLQFQRTVTSGIISALNRTIRIKTDQGVNYMENLIQTDASINPGNSGGPLLNARGEVIGINTIKVVSAEGLGFAIPINIAKPIINSFITKGRFDEPYLGVFAYDKEVIPFIEPTLNTDGGVYVAKVDPKSPAAIGGIKVGDVITKIDGTPVNTMADLRTVVYTKNPNNRITLTIINRGIERTITCILGKKSRDGLLTR